MELITELEPGPIGVDTAIFVYLVEENKEFLTKILPLFKAADEGRRELVTSALTLLEVLVVPYRAGDSQLAERYETILTRSRGVRVIDITRDQLKAAAQLRAVTGIKTPDALQLVAAIAAGCRSFVTNDRRLPEISGLRVVQLSDSAT